MEKLTSVEQIVIVVLLCMLYHLLFCKEKFMMHEINESAMLFFQKVLLVRSRFCKNFFFMRMYASHFLSL